jgi:hypothetical protein
MVSRYQKRISGPLLDRLDIHIDVPRVEYEKLSDERLGEPSAAIQARVQLARPFTADAQRGANLSIEDLRLPRQFIASQDHDSQPRRQSGEETPQGRVDGKGFPVACRIPICTCAGGSLTERETLCRLTLALTGQLDLTPNSVHNTGPGVGGEGRPSLRVEAQNGAPQANATGLQGLSKRQVAQDLLPHDGMD